MKLINRINTDDLRGMLCLLMVAVALAACGNASDDAIATQAAFPNDPGRILFVNRSNIYTMNPDGTDLQQLTDSEFGHHYRSAAWSPDGSQIAYIESRDLFVMNADGSNPQNLTSSLEVPVPVTSFHWAPDGYQIAIRFIDDLDQDLAIINADGSNFRRLTVGGAGTPSWSPDGSQLVFSNRGRLYRLIAGEDGFQPLFDDGEYYLGLRETSL